MRRQRRGDQVVRGEPVRDLGAVDRVPVQVVDRVARAIDDIGHVVPVDRERGVGPVQHVVLVHPREQQLAAESVVVAHAGARDGEAEDPVEDHGVLHELGVLAGVGIACLVRAPSRTDSRNAVRSQRSSSSE